ncbi:Crp/Fnr family transcriptional regulator [Magnetospirillum sp. UT-4]|uniref:Crp/Fnr family transcriptional regulator n=1 Tax=Magnetospirillum sp. UT-4 TaxID=2681467 RepID=UPI00138309DA|nr:Crp/Fnr family transcriptional regulator [Magnetospirillum sp. UT-4]CAA7625875.1 cAMP-binding protein [Magnetospirillum sp. UT-4]
MTKTEEGLARFALFAGLTPEDLAAIEARCTWHRFEVGDQVFDRDSDTLEVYFVVTGAVRILTQRADCDIALADVVAGNYFGELAAIDGLRRSARVVVTQAARLASLPGPAFLEVMHAHPEVAVRVLERLTRIVRALDHRVAELATTSETQRICGELVRLAEPEQGKPDAWIIADLPNHKELAAWVGTTRETVAQAIGELARDGVVRRRGIGLVISDWPRLQLMARA